MPDLAEICNQCKEETSKEIDAISDKVFALEQEVDRLRAENGQLSSRPQESEDIKAFLDAMEPTIANEEKIKGRQDYKWICALYRVIRPK